jgi:hypothetical protein
MTSAQRGDGPPRTLIRGWPAGRRSTTPASPTHPSKDGPSTVPPDGEKTRLVTHSGEREIGHGGDDALLPERHRCCVSSVSAVVTARQ